MSAYVSSEDTAPPKRSVTRIDWFLREPGGGTVFVKPDADLGATVRPGVDRTDHASSAEVEGLAAGSPDTQP